MPANNYALPKNDADNERLTKILLELEDKESLSAEEDALFESIILMVQNYEQKHYPMGKLAPADALRTSMEDRSLRQKDIAEIIGNKSVTSQILSGQREISESLAGKLADGLGLSIKLFL